MKQLTSLAISALLLLTACGQTESAPDNQTALPPPAMQRPSQNLCKPPMWCRIEAPHWRFL